MPVMNLIMFASMLIGLVVGVVGALVIFRFVVFSRSQQTRLPYLLMAPFVFLGIVAGMGASMFFSLKIINMLNRDNMLTAILLCGFPILIAVLYLATRNDAQWEKWTNHK
jgi:hypothetical protein